MRIILLKTWLYNIGNGFIDMGAKAALEQAMPDAEVVETSGYPNFVAEEKATGNAGNLVSRALGRDIGTDRRDEIFGNVVNVAEMLDGDVAVLPGCVLSEHALSRYAPVLESLRERDIPIVLLGASGSSYDDNEYEYVTEQLQRLEPDALITRDNITYDWYADQVPCAERGIDNAFFIDDWFTPPELNEELDVRTFDKRDEPPSLGDGGEYRIVRPHHNSFGYPFQGITKQFVRQPDRRLNLGNSYVEIAKEILRTPVEDDLFSEEGVFFSDSLKDYLTIYGNAAETHSDRVHACVPTLVYGNRARLQFSTLRADLFNRVTDEEDITEGFVTIDEERLTTEKEKQVSALRTALKRATEQTPKAK